MMMEADNTRNFLAFLSTAIPSALSKDSFSTRRESTLMSKPDELWFINMSFRHVAAIYDRADST
jgi:hypothetical protein